MQFPGGMVLSCQYLNHVTWAMFRAQDMMSGKFVLSSTFMWWSNSSRLVRLFKSFHILFRDVLRVKKTIEVYLVSDKLIRT